MKHRKDRYRKMRKADRDRKKKRDANKSGVHKVEYIGPKPKIPPWVQREVATYLEQE